MQWEFIKKRLSGLPIPDFRYYPTTGSTNEEALNWAAQGAANGSLVIADQQTSGRGRQGRKWITKAGAGLALSFIFRPDENEKKHLQLFSPLGALAVCQAIKTYLSIEGQVKWPNDILINRKKAGGVLAEAHWQAGQIEALVLGIGINISLSSVPEQMTLRFPATSLEAEYHHKIDRLDFLRAVCSQVFSTRPLLGSTTFMELWTELLAFKGEKVILETSENNGIQGVIKGLNAEGNLILQEKNGFKKSFRMGEVRLLPIT